MHRLDRLRLIRSLVCGIAFRPNSLVYHHFDGIPVLPAKKCHKLVLTHILQKTKEMSNNFGLPHFCQSYIGIRFATVFQSLSSVHNQNSIRPHWNVPYPNSSRAMTIPFPAYLLRSSFWKIRPACSLRPIWNRWIDAVCHFLWTYAIQSNRQSVGNSPIQCRCHWIDPLCQFYCFWTQYSGRSV